MLAPGATAKLTVTWDSSLTSGEGDQQGFVILDGASHDAHMPAWMRVTYKDMAAADVLIIDNDGSSSLGLPDYASTALLFGILRKEMAFETLVVLAGTASLDTVMTGVQLYTFAIVSTLFVPCISTIAVLRRELGTRIAALITVYTVALGLAIGILVHVFAG